MALASPSALATTVNLLAPSPNWQINTRFNGNFTADANGNLYNVPITEALVEMLSAGCVVVPYNIARNYRNILDGGEFSVNPWQRNIPGWASAGVISSAITNTPTYLADRWFGVGGASSSVLLSKISVAGVAALPGFDTSLQLQRSSGNANLSPIYVGQIVENRDVIALQGQTVTFSFWAQAQANFSAANNLLSVQMFSGTGVNDSATNMIAGSWAGSATPLNTTQTINGVWNRYSFTAVVPLTATALGFLVGYTPVGTAGTTDGVQFAGFQAEIGAIAGPVERRDIQTELALAQRFAWVIAEPANNVIVAIGANSAAANNQNFLLATPEQLVKAPTVSVAAGSWKVAAGAGAASATGFAAGGTHTVNQITLVTTLTQSVGGAAHLQGGGGSGYVIVDSDFH